MKEIIIEVPDGFGKTLKPEKVNCEIKGEIVRCRDCVNCIKEPNGDLYCDALAVEYEPLGSKMVTDDWFCADGIRKKKTE